MRKPSAAQIAFLVGSVIATGASIGPVHSQEQLPPVQVQGYILLVYAMPQNNGWNLGPLAPTSGTGPGDANSASPNAHVQCTANYMAAQLRLGASSSPPQPNNTSLAIPIRADNPIDIAYGAPVAGNSEIGNVGGFAEFSNLWIGISVAQDSLSQYTLQYYTITQLINQWSNNSSTALSNTLSGLGMSSTIAADTKLVDLTTAQDLQIIAAFAWQEGFKPSGC
jgi:hypothetical protein